MTEYNIRLNPNCAAAVHTGLKFKSGDKGIEFKIAVDELDTTGTTAKIVFLRANGTSVESDITGTDGVYTYKTLGNEFAVPGKTVADVKFYAADARVSTASFVFEVSGDTMDGLGAGAGGYSDRLEQLATEAEDAMKNAENVSKELENLLTVYQNKFGEVGVLNPKGTYNSATIYEAFDLVYYGGVSWLCLQRCTGVTPAEGAYWQLFASADGGNAAKLGGKSASELSVADANYLNVQNGNEVNFKGLTNQDTVSFNFLDADTGEASKTPIKYYNFCPNQKSGANLVQIDLTEGSGRRKVIHTGNVGSYALPKSGGTISGSLKFKTVDNGYTEMTKAHGSDFDNGTAIYDYDSTGSYVALVLQRKNGLLRYYDDHGGKDILHTGNKPTGSYTGNGSAEARTFNTGGIGKCIAVWSEYGVALITDNKATVISSNGESAFYPSGNIAYFRDSVFSFYSSIDALNKSGVTYYYQVL